MVSISASSPRRRARLPERALARRELRAHLVDARRLRSQVDAELPLARLELALLARLGVQLHGEAGVRRHWPAIGRSSPLRLRGVFSHVAAPSSASRRSECEARAAAAAPPTRSPSAPAQRRCARPSAEPARWRARPPGAWRLARRSAWRRCSASAASAHRSSTAPRSSTSSLYWSERRARLSAAASEDLRSARSLSRRAIFDARRLAIDDATLGPSIVGGEFRTEMGSTFADDDPHRGACSNFTARLWVGDSWFTRATCAPCRHCGALGVGGRATCLAGCRDAFVRTAAFRPTTEKLGAFISGRSLRRSAEAMRDDGGGRLRLAPRGRASGLAEHACGGGSLRQTRAAVTRQRTTPKSASSLRPPTSGPSRERVMLPRRTSVGEVGSRAARCEAARRRRVLRRPVPRLRAAAGEGRRAHLLLLEPRAPRRGAGDAGGERVPGAHEGGDADVGVVEYGRSPAATRSPSAWLEARCGGGEPIALHIFISG